MSDHEHPTVPIIPTPYGVPPAWVRLRGQIVTDDGVTVIDEELWIVGFLDPLLNQPAAGMPVVLTAVGALSVGSYVHRRQIQDVSWSIAIQTPGMLQQEREQQRAAMAALQQQAPRIHVAGPLGPRS